MVKAISSLSSTPPPSPRAATEVAAAAAAGSTRGMTCLRCLVWFSVVCVTITVLVENRGARTNNNSKNSDNDTSKMLENGITRTAAIRDDHHDFRVSKNDTNTSRLRQQHGSNHSNVLQNMTTPQRLQRIPAALVNETSNSTTQQEQQQPAQTTQNQNDDDPLNLPPEFRVCRLNNPAPQLGQGRIPDEETGFRMWYQCDGKPYHDYIQHHQNPFVLRRHKGQNQHWGTRPTLVPNEWFQGRINNMTDTVYKNKPIHILAMGNSHTRQLINSMLCQYRESINRITILPKGIASIYELYNSSVTITLVVNSGLSYTPHWKERIIQAVRWENITSMKSLETLNDFDTVIVGTFNRYDPSYKNTTLWRHVRLESDSHLEDKPHGISFEEVTEAFDGPVTFVSMFAPFRYSQGEDLPDAEDLIQRRQRRRYFGNKRSRRTNLYALYGRYYIEHKDALNGVECSSDNRLAVGTCNTNREDLRYSSGHRCFGAFGGYSDLIAWDVVEVLYQQTLERHKGQGGTVVERRR